MDILVAGAGGNGQKFSGRGRERDEENSPAQGSIRKYYRWLEKAVLKDGMEALNTIAQEQALSSTAIVAVVYYTKQSPRYRLCKEA